MKSYKIKNLSLQMITGALSVMTLAGCLESNTPDTVDGNGGGDIKETKVEYVQVERLARPAINEGLILSNDLLNTFNAVPPTADLSDAAIPVRDEAVKVLTILNTLGNNLKAIFPSFAPPEVGNVAAGFLPDVMRIDITAFDATAINSRRAKNAYNSCANYVDGVTGQAILCGGRKIKDDVADITLSYLIAGDPSDLMPVKDGVDFSGANGWHHGVLGNFPFVWTPVTSN